MAFASVVQLQTALLTSNPTDFVSRHIFEPIPHAFGTDLDLWVTWKRQLATHLEVDPYELVLTGSAATGFSLNPKKEFRGFNDRSDIDVGVISLHHFDLAWRYLRQLRASWLSLPKKTRRAITAHRSNYVFAGTIATDYMLPLLPFGRPWQAGLDEMAKVQPTLGRDVKLRIYRDFDSLRSYQAYGIGQLREALLESPQGDEEAPITEEA
jgi:hypothetical protein